MTSAVSLTTFHHWLLEAKPDMMEKTRVIVLHGAKSFPALIDSITHYLNEYDEEAHGGWLAATDAMISAIAADAAQRRLLAVDAPCEKCPPTGPCGLRKVIAGMAKHGHVVLDSVHAAQATADLNGVFHVSLAAYHKDCHLHLNASRFDQRCLAPIIADVYLEWLQCCHRASLSS